MRLFIAIELNDDIKTELSIIQENVKSDSIKGKYTAIDNFHLTLHFLGEVGEDKSEDIKSVIEKVAEGTAPFEIYLNSLGHFPKKQRHIIWAGVKGNLDPLYKLNQNIRKELKNLDDNLEYTPHITLGRQIKLNQTFNELSQTIVIPEMPMSVQFISLMESKREEGKLVYKPIFRKYLTKN